MLLENKVCVITGCNRGIGAAALELFAREGAVIYANSRKEGSLEEKKIILEKKYDCEIIPVYFDVRDTLMTKELFGRIQREQGRLDVLVNNAGIMQDALIGMITKDMIQQIFETNVYSVIDMIQYASRIMKRNRKGSIINFSSIVGVEGNSGQLVYSASKGAVNSLTKSASKELAQYNIRVNAVAPGMIDTDMLRSIGDEKVEGYLKVIGMGRLGSAYDVAKMCVVLASDYSEYVTGQVIGINGSTII